MTNQSTNQLAPVDADYSCGGRFTGEIGVGYDFGAIRTELTYAYKNYSSGDLQSPLGKVNINGGSTNLNSGYLSAYWDIPVGGRFVPYIGAGIGYTNYSYSSVNQGGVPFNGASAGTFG